MVLPPAASGAGPVPSATPAGHVTRWHFVLPGAPPLAYSVHFIRDAAGDRTRLLVAVGDERFDLLSTQDPSSLDTTETITRLSTGEALSRRLVLPGGALPAECPALEMPDACVLLSGKGGRLALPLTAFGGEKAPATREKAGALVSDGMAASLRLLAAQVPRSYELDRYGDDFLSLVWPGIVPKRASPPPPGQRRPACAFDATFGVPCTPADRDRETARFGR